MRLHFHTTRLGRIVNDNMAGVTVTRYERITTLATAAHPGGVDEHQGEVLELQVSLWWCVLTVWLEWGQP